LSDYQIPACRSMENESKVEEWKSEKAEKIAEAE
jgi:hypothetical protein